MDVTQVQSPDELLDVLREVLAREDLSDSALRMFTCLGLNAESGCVSGLSSAELAKRAGMKSRDASQAIRELVAAGCVTSSQIRPYQPNRYEVLPLACESAETACPFPTSGSGPSGRRRQDPLRDPVGVPRGPVATLVDQRAEEAPRDSEENESCAKADELWMSLGRSKATTPAVHFLIRNPPPGFRWEEIYLGFRYLVTVQKLAPPKDGMGWTELSQLLESGKLHEPGIADVLRQAITESPQRVRVDRVMESLLDDELAAWQRVYGEK